MNQSPHQLDEKIKGNILAVDDDLSSLRAVLTMLGEQGYEVRGAPDGSTALMMANSELPELVLLDIAMPGMDGFEVCRRLKSEPATSDVPIIFLSASGDMTDKIKGFELGAIDYISKPFQVEEVLARVQTHVALYRFHEQARIEAIDAERNRLARELHDSVTQSLFLSASIAETVPRIWERDPDRARQALADMRRLTHGALAEMRAMLLELRPAAITEHRLDVLLQQLADGMLARTQMTVQTDLVKVAPLPDDVQIALYRIAQEALNNVIKHARADETSLTLQSDFGQVVLGIHDDGIGFELDTLDEGCGRQGMGMTSMCERAKAIGAEIEIQSKRKQGTHVTVTWSMSTEQSQMSRI